MKSIMSWIKKIVTIVKDIFLTILGVILPLTVFELALRNTTVFDQLDAPLPTYIPEYLRIEDKRIYEEGGHITEDNFRTLNADIKNLTEKFKTDLGCKVVVLGDSFVMGDGVAASATWVAKLANKTKCTVYPFGRNGWTSYEQFGFYDNALSQEHIDYLIVGVVSNDPHPRGKFGKFEFSRNHSVSSTSGLTNISEYLLKLIIL